MLLHTPPCTFWVILSSGWRESGDSDERWELEYYLPTNSSCHQLLYLPQYLHICREEIFFHRIKLPENVNLLGYWMRLFLVLFLWYKMTFIFSPLMRDIMFIRATLGNRVWEEDVDPFCFLIICPVTGQCSSQQPIS